MIGKGKHILIVAYIFPPTQGIGGRRWAKFAKYFTKLGYTVHVICSVQHNREISLWIDDVKDNPNIIIYGIIQKYPAVLGRIPTTFYEKLKYKVALKYVSLVAKGSLYDTSIFWKGDFEKMAENILSTNNIETAYVSIAPMQHATILIKLKNIFPNTKFVVDFRDPWYLGGRYGFPQKNPNRDKYELEAEKNICEKFDLITMPYTEVIMESSNFFKVPLNKYYRLQHAIDFDDFSFESNHIKNNYVLVSYIGTLYPDLKAQFDSIFKVADKINNLKFDFYTSNNNESYFEFAKKEHINFHKQIEPKTLFTKLSNSNFILIVFSETMKSMLYTKFVEIVCARIPIILVSNIGEASDFITQNNLGIHLKYNEVENKLQQILEIGFMDNYNYNFDLTEFSFEKVTQNLVDRVLKI